MTDLLEDHISHTFDSFCKTVLRNEARDIKRYHARLRKHQTSLSNVPEEILEHIVTNEPLIDNLQNFREFNTDIAVANMNLAESIERLSNLRRKIILLFYFVGLNDREISEAIGMSLGGVWYQRSKAIEDLKKTMGNY